MLAQRGGKFPYSLFGKAFRKRNIKEGDMINAIRNDGCFPVLFFKPKTILQRGASGKVSLLHRVQFLLIYFTKSFTYFIKSTHKISCFSFKHDRVNPVSFIVKRCRSCNDEFGPEIFLKKGAREYFQPFALVPLFFFAERLRI